jgi:hypothetical protein
MLIQNSRTLLPLLGLVLAASCTKSVCETKNDCPVGNVCSAGACIKACTADTECPGGEYCDLPTGFCAKGCRSSAECADSEVCAGHTCWPVSTPISPVDGGDSDAPAPTCRCLLAPRACLDDINPASPTAGTSVCEPASPPRAIALFFGNVGCSHCQSIFGNLLLIEEQLRGEGLDPQLAFVQLKDQTYTGEQVTSTFPTHKGPVLQDTGEGSSTDGKFWGSYGASWYDVKIIDSYGCLSAFFTSDDTMGLMAGGELQAAGILVKDAWRAAMGSECHALPDAGAAGSGP